MSNRPPAPLTPSDLLGTRPLKRLGSQVLCVDEIDSTNAHLTRNAAQLPDGTILAAEFQTAGRGRLSRRWHSPPGSSILLSVLLKEPASSQVIAESTLIAARTMCLAIRTIAQCPCEIRWPNDLFVRGKKVGGVLAESTYSANAHERDLVVGVGVNCFQRSVDFAPELRPRATSLAIEVGRMPNRGQIAAAFLAQFDTALHGYTLTESAGTKKEPGDLSARSDAMLPHCADVGRDITLRVQNRLVRGKVLGCRLNGDLFLRSENGTERFIEAVTATRVEESH